MDGRKNNGSKKGVYQGQGRPPKAKEIELIQRLSPLDDIALKALENGVKSGEFQFVKLFMEYRFGKPKENISLSGNDIEIKVNWKEGF